MSTPQTAPCPHSRPLSRPHSRAHSRPHSRSPTPYTRNVLTLHHYLYSQDVFDIYAAYLGSLSVLLKVTNLATFEPSELPSLLATLHRELDLAKRLAGQGLAPAFLGMYGSAQPDRSQLLALVFAQARELTRIERHDSKMAAEIIGVYKRLHELGVVHGSVGWRYVRMVGDEVVLFDFEHASERGEADWEGRREEEAAKVKALVRWK